MTGGDARPRGGGARASSPFNEQQQPAGDLAVGEARASKRLVACLGNDYERYWRVAGQADGDRADDTVRDKRGAADHDDDGCVRVRGADVFSGRDQFLRDQPLAALEAPALLAPA